MFHFGQCPVALIIFVDLFFKIKNRWKQVEFNHFILNLATLLWTLLLYLSGNTGDVDSATEQHIS